MKSIWFGELVEDSWGDYSRLLRVVRRKKRRDTIKRKAENMVNYTKVELRKAVGIK